MRKVKDVNLLAPRFSSFTSLFPIVSLQSSRRYGFHRDSLMPRLLWCCRYDLPRWQKPKIMQ